MADLTQPGNADLPGIRCPRCRSRNLRVLRTQLVPAGKVRQRECKDCRFRRIFTSEIANQGKA